jgi:hypothetical protein
MGHYAKVVDGIVEQVIVAKKDFIDTLEDSESWIKTSYNTRGGIHYNPETGEPDGGIPLRMNYACIGGAYDADRDAFIPPKPYNSWLLNEGTLIWEAPIPYPDDFNGQLMYFWDEDTLSWIED